MERLTRLDMERLIPRTEVQDRVGLSKSAIYRRLELGLFPRPLEVGAGSVRWKFGNRGLD